MAAHSAPSTLLSVPADQPASGYPEWFREMARAINLIAAWSENQTISPRTFATLPALPVAGSISFITDGSVTAWGANAAGGGATPMLIWHNGTAWKVLGT